MSDPSTDKHQSAGNNIGADYPAGNACQQAPQQGVLKECIKMSSKELNRRRKRDWIFLLIGVPAFIALLYLIALALR